jgi:hypothetical protein
MAMANPWPGKDDSFLGVISLLLFMAVALPLGLFQEKPCLSTLIIIAVTVVSTLAISGVI